MAENNDFKHIVRVANTDLEGNKSLGMALQKIKGVSYALSHALCYTLGLDETMKTGTLTSEQVNDLNAAIKNPVSKDIPSWMLNRRKDLETGHDMHMTGSDLSYNVSNDIKSMMKLKIYRGTRHSSKLPVRGQKTKANYRRSKVKNAAKRKIRK